MITEKIKKLTIILAELYSDNGFSTFNVKLCELFTFWKQPPEVTRKAMEKIS